MADYSSLQSCTRLQPPCDLNALDAVEMDLKYTFPDEYHDFLLAADGGILTDAVILFSAGQGIDPSETLLAANLDRPGLPVVLVGRFADEEFGFLRSEMSAPTRGVYVYKHETDGLRKIADSFEGFLRAVVRGERF